MSDLNNCAFTGVMQEKQAMRDVGSSKVVNFSIEGYKKLPDGKVIKNWPKFEAWGNNADKADAIATGSRVAVVGEYQVRKDKNDDNRYYHSFNVRQLEELE